MPSSTAFTEPNLKTSPAALPQGPRAVAAAMPALPLAPPVEMPRKALGFAARMLGSLRRPRREAMDTPAVAERPLGNAYDHSFSGHWMVRL